jgi:hypothetical protein
MHTPGHRRPCRDTGETSLWVSAFKFSVRLLILVIFMVGVQSTWRGAQTVLTGREKYSREIGNGRSEGTTFSRSRVVTLSICPFYRSYIVHWSRHSFSNRREVFPILYAS